MIFGQVTTRLTWIWVAVLSGMTVSSSIPPIVRGDAIDPRRHHAAVLHRLLGHPVLVVGPGALATQIPARLDDRRGRRHRPNDHIRRLRRSHHRRAVLPRAGTCQPRGRCRARRPTTSRSEVWAHRWWATTPDTRGPRRTKCASRVRRRAPSRRASPPAVDPTGVGGSTLMCASGNIATSPDD